MITKALTETHKTKSENLQSVKANPFKVTNTTVNSVELPKRWTSMFESINFCSRIQYEKLQKNAFYCNLLYKVKI